MVDRFGRTIEYLRLSITDKCNLRCRYCMPKDGVTPVSHDDILRYEEITRLAGIFAHLGIRKIRITGGEPLVRKGVCDLIGRLKSVDGVENVSLTTNGVLLRELAQDLKAAGTDGINISLDTVNEETFRKLTGFDGLPQVMEGLKTAFDRGMRLKINCVPVWGINEGDLCDIAQFAKDRPVENSCPSVKAVNLPVSLQMRCSTFWRSASGRAGRYRIGAADLPGCAPLQALPDGSASFHP